MDGLYYALLEGRFLFDFVHEDKLAPKELAKYSALLLPNTALLSDAQCRQLRAYVEGGGSLLATFETSLYNERNRAARRFRPGRRLRHPQGRRDHRHHRQRLPGAHRKAARNPQRLLRHELDSRRGKPRPVAPVEDPVLTVVPGFVAYPPELSYPVEPRTSEPAMVVRQKGPSRLVYFPGDIERTMWRSGHTDLARLLRNAIAWVAGGDAPVTVTGQGVIETFAWETQAGFALHLLNYTNPAMHRGWLREFYAIGPQNVKMSLPAGRKVTRVELLRAETNLPFAQRGGSIEFTIPKVVDYEVAAMYSA